MEVNEFYKKFFCIDTPFAHQMYLFRKLQSGIFPLILKSPTGSGKTEAVLAPFLYQFLKNEFVIAPRLIYVLPMRVLVNNTAERIESYAKRVSHDITVDIQHGDVPGAPFFMSDVVVTTLDQFVYAFARASSQVGRHLDMPAGAIASSIVVFDEAHMYRDEYTFSIMKALMEILYKTNIPFVIMTATMPDSLKDSLFENIPLSEEQIITGSTGVKSRVNIKIIKDKLVKEDEINLPDELLEKIKASKTLIVLNQVERAQRVYEALKNKLSLNNGEIVLLHSRFTNANRRKHEEEALSLIPHKRDGKKINPEGTGIVIATQVLEAGIDFSTELLITELAPADCLIQRAGRCARYDGEEGEMIIFTEYIDRSERAKIQKAKGKGKKKKDKEETVKEEIKDYLPYKNEDLVKTLEWLENNPQFNIKEFEEVCRFVNVLDYRANDYEASDSLIDLYECVLYADSEPENIQVRESKPVTLVVMDLPDQAKKGKKKNKAAAYPFNDYLAKHDIKDSSLSADIKVAWKLLKKDCIKGELRWKYEEGNFIPELEDLTKKGSDEEARIAPFKKYVLAKSHYSEEKGIIL